MTSEPISSMSELLSSMEPELDPDKYVYCTVPAELPRRLGTKATCSFRESEGETLILRSAEAEKHHLALTFPCRKITLRVHSSLEAIEFLPVIAGELATDGISTNCVSAYYHDHLFVLAPDGERALSVLREPQRRSKRTSHSEIAS